MRLKTSPCKTLRCTSVAGVMLCLTFLVSGCSGSSSATGSGSNQSGGQEPSATTKAAASTSPSETASTPAPPSCPNPEGGVCLGRLEPGLTYTTQEFDPAITYQVPTKAGATSRTCTATSCWCLPATTWPE